MTVQTIVNMAFFDLGQVAANESPAQEESDDAFARLNEMLASWSLEQLSVYTEKHQTFALQAGKTDYTFGDGGEWNTGAGIRPVKLAAWSGFLSGLSRRGGEPVSFAEFAKRAIDGFGASASVPEILAADTAYPRINVRCFPNPSSAPGQIEATFWTPLAQFATLATEVTLPLEYFGALHLNLAIQLYPQYPRQGGIDPVLAANAQNAKQAIVAKNIAGPQPQAPPPNQQQ